MRKISNFDPEINF